MFLKDQRFKSYVVPQIAGCFLNICLSSLAFWVRGSEHSGLLTAKEHGEFLTDVAPSLTIPALSSLLSPGQGSPCTFSKRATSGETGDLGRFCFLGFFLFFLQI